MKRIAAAALATTMAIGAMAPTAGAAPKKHPFDQYLISAPLGNKMINNGKDCKITYTGSKRVGEHLDDPSLPAYTTEEEYHDVAKKMLAENEAFLKEIQDSYRSLLMQFYTGTTIDRDEDKLKELPDVLYAIEYQKAKIACGKGEDYQTNFITQQSSKMTQAGRAATFWTPIALLIAGVLGAVALPALKPMLPANIAAMLP